jgi:hypothetical protein
MLNGLNGLFLRYDPDARNFVPAASDDFYVPGNGRSLTVVEVGGRPAVVATENEGPTRAFVPAGMTDRVRIAAGDRVQRIYFTLPDGRPSVEEVYYGSGYLSQRSRTVWLPAGSRNIEVVDFAGQRRAITPELSR